MKQIWKYPLTTIGAFDIDMPIGATVLCVQVQHESPVMWAIVHPDREKELRHFYVVGTGHPFPHHRSDLYIGTFQGMGGALIWHIFERPNGAIDLPETSEPEQPTKGTQWPAE